MSLFGCKPPAVGMMWAGLITGSCHVGGHLEGVSMSMKYTATAEMPMQTSFAK